MLSFLRRNKPKKKEYWPLYLVVNKFVGYTCGLLEADKYHATDSKRPSTAFVKIKTWNVFLKAYEYQYLFVKITNIVDFDGNKVYIGNRIEPKQYPVGVKEEVKTDEKGTVYKVEYDDNDPIALNNLTKLE